MSRYLFCGNAASPSTDRFVWGHVEDKSEPEDVGYPVGVHITRYSVWIFRANSDNICNLCHSWTVLTATTQEDDNFK